MQKDALTEQSLTKFVTTSTGLVRVTTLILIVQTKFGKLETQIGDNSKSVINMSN